MSRLEFFRNLKSKLLKERQLDDLADKIVAKSITITPNITGTIDPINSIDSMDFDFNPVRRTTLAP